MITSTVTIAVRVEGDTVDEVADNIAEAIKAEAAQLAKAGYIVQPDKIRVGDRQRVDDVVTLLSITLTAGRA